MLLNHLKNNEIYPYFWRSRDARDKDFSVEFIDLNSLKRELREVANSPLQDDHKLERALYGEGEGRFFSGWTQGRLNHVLAKCGFATPEISNHTHLRSRVSAIPGSWNERQRRESKRWRRESLIWNWRKQLRSNAGGAKARLISLFKKVDLTRNDLWLNLGAGAESYPNYVKIDISGTQDVYDNIITLEKITNASVERIYCNHVLEHIPHHLLLPMLRRWLEVLKPGGKIYARIPDARQSLLCLGERWVETSEQELVRLGLPNFLEREPLREGILDDNACIQMIYGWSDSTPHSWDDINQHKSLWTPALARERFMHAGFQIETAQNLGSLNTLIVATRERV